VLRRRYRRLPVLTSALTLVWGWWHVCLGQRTNIRTANGSNQRSSARYRHWPFRCCSSSAWQRCSAGEGAKGHRYYDWAWLAIDPGQPGHRHLLIRRSRRTGELAFYRCYSPRRVPLPALVKIAGIRWTTEENFQAGKGLTGLDEHQVRRWDSWYRWTTLAMLALAFLSITAAAEHAHPPPAGQIPLTRNEIAALFSTLIIKPVTGTPHRLRWSAWRRRHQHRAKTCHYQRQARQS
jgi:hypothetical protein